MGQRELWSARDWCKWDNDLNGNGTPDAIGKLYRLEKFKHDRAGVALHLESGAQAYRLPVITALQATL